MEHLEAMAAAVAGPVASLGLLGLVHPASLGHPCPVARPCLVGRNQDPSVEVAHHQDQTSALVELHGGMVAAHIPVPLLQ